MDIEEALKHATLPVPVAGKAFYNLGYNASYAAANRGVIPTVSLGGNRKVAVVARIAESLGLQTKFLRSESPQHPAQGDDKSGSGS